VFVQQPFSSQGVLELCANTLRGKCPSLFYLTLDLIFDRFHYGQYLKICESRDIEPKAHPPAGWKERKNQKKVDPFLVAVKSVPPIMKAGLKEFIVELVADGDLVSPSLPPTVRVPQNLVSVFLFHGKGLVSAHGSLPVP